MSKSKTQPKNVFYRNVEDIKSKDGILIDAGSLWKMNQKGVLVLVDDDQYIEAVHDSKLFEQVS